MRRSKFTDSQVVEILKALESGIPAAELLRKHGISRATLFNWKAKYGGTTVAELRRLRDLEAENAKLKRMYAELAHRREVLEAYIFRSLAEVRAETEAWLVLTLAATFEFLRPAVLENRRAPNEQGPKHSVN